VTDPLERAHLGAAAAEVRAEWRTDEEEWTRAAVERWQHQRTLLDVICECMLRGDTIALRLGHITFTGLVQAIGDDLVALAAADGRVDVRVDDHTQLIVRVHERARTGGTRGDAVTTFRARLLELEMDELDVEIGTGAGGDVVCGQLTVGRDHVIVHEHVQTDTVMALAAVAWVRRAPA
jgi:hypothetical protein